MMTVEKKVMVMADDGACIGCGACARVCPTNCQTHEVAETSTPEQTPRLLASAST